jgi:hypothetical protein
MSTQTQTVRVALYKTRHGTILAMRNDEWLENSPDYTRVSQYLDAEFIMLDDSELLNAEIEAIDAEIEIIKNKALAEVENLLARKQELLALTTGGV